MPTEGPTQSPTKTDKASAASLNDLNEEQKSGAISGIVIGSVLVCALLCLVIFWCCLGKRKYSDKTHPEKDHAAVTASHGQDVVAIANSNNTAMV